MRGTRLLVFGLLVAAILTFVMAVPAMAATQFTDTDDSDYAASIVALASRGFVGGYDDGTFRPDNLLQRQQFAKMAVLTLGYAVSVDDQSSFSDTPAPYDAANPLYPGAYVAVAAKQSIILGHTDGSFGFTENVSRQQAITIVVRAAGTALDNPPADYQGVLDYSDPVHGANLKKAEYNGLLAGITDLATWDPTANATRAEAAELLAQLFYRTGKILKVAGPSGSLEFTLAELKAMTATEGYGGWKNKVGNITGPRLYKGVAVKDLLALTGGTSTASAIAADGYEAKYSEDDLAGNVSMFDPATGDPITSIDGSITMILAYSVDGQPLKSSEGALRIALVSPKADQVTSSGKWASQVVEIDAQ
jgi:hypothetical protein